MTNPTPPEQPNGGPVPPLDPGNPFVNGQLPAQMTCLPVPTTNGQKLLVTIRSGGTTLTLILEKADGEQWSALLAKGSAMITGGNIITPPKGLFLPGQNGSH
jgi:hypothetical protein